MEEPLRRRIGGRRERRWDSLLRAAQEMRERLELTRETGVDEPNLLREGFE